MRPVLSQEAAPTLAELRSTVTRTRTLLEI